MQFDDNHEVVLAGDRFHPPGDPMAHLTSRRRLLAAAAAATGGMGLSGLMQPDAADASHNLTTAFDGFDGYNNVLHPDFGDAYNDGTHATETTAAIKQCVNQSAAANPEDRRAVYFPPGTYALDRSQLPLLIPSNSVLLGHGALSVLVVEAGTGTPANTMIKIDASIDRRDIRIQDLTLDANNSLKSYVIYAVPNASTFERIWLRRVEVRNHKWQATVPATDDDFASYAVRLGTAFGSEALFVDCRVEDCHIHDTHRDGINVSGTNFLIRGNVVERCGDDHITAGGRAIVANNVCVAEKANRGSCIYVGIETTVVGNVCVGGVQGGISVRGKCHDAVIADNIVLNSGRVTPPLNGPPTPASNPSGNPAWGVAKGSGIVVLAQPGSTSGAINRIKIRNNHINNPRNNGVSISASGYPINDVDVSGNWISCGAASDQGDVGQSGIAVVGPVPPPPQTDSPAAFAVTNLRICDNDIGGAKGPGISVRGVDDDAKRPRRLIIDGNRVLNSGPNQPGVLIEEVDGFLVSGNQVQDAQSTKTQQHGLKMVNPRGSSNLVDSNVFSENAGNGIDPAPPMPANVTYGTNLT